MSANIFKHEFRTRIQSLLIWSFSASAIIFIVFSIFPVFADQAELMNSMLARMPKELLAAFGMDTIDLSTVLGYFSFILVFVQLCLAIQAGNYGFGLVSIEESELTADFLMTKPVSRVRILTSKLLAVLANLIITNLVVWGVSFASIAIFRGEREYEVQTLVLLLASLIIFQLFFVGVGLVVSLLVKKVRNVTPYSMGLGFGAYVLSAFSGVFGDVKLELITPFKHLDPSYIIQHGAFNIPLLILNLGITVVALVVSYWLYFRRDIHAVS